MAAASPIVERGQDHLRTYIETPDTYVETVDYDLVMRALAKFFQNEGYTEVCTQSRFSILAACEDPTTIACVTYCGNIWPLPQTGQMSLEYELMTRPDLKGVYCRTTSYREEKNIVPGRHYVCFPMFEFETRGTFDDLLDLLTRLVIFLGYPAPVHLDYATTAKQYGVEQLEHEHERRMCEENGPVCFLKDFPEHTSPFWNMKRDETGTHAKKVDVIMSHHETIGAAERSCDNEAMRKGFYTISNGEYCETIFAKCGKERTEKELEAFLGLEKVERFGAGLGVTRLIASLKKEGLMDQLREKLTSQ